MPDYKAVGRQYAESYGVDWGVFERQIQEESGWNPHPRHSSAGAVGIAQIMPDTARQWGVDPNDPIASLAAAARAMADYLRRWNGSYPHALAAYNWGPGRVETWNGTRERLPGETRRYLDDILGPDWLGLEAPDQVGAGTTQLDISGLWDGIKDWWTAKKDAAEGGAVEVVAPWVVGAAGIMAVSIGAAALVLRSPPAKLVTQVAKQVPNPYVQGGARLAGTVQR